MPYHRPLIRLGASLIRRQKFLPPKIKAPTHYALGLTTFFGGIEVKFNFLNENKNDCFSVKFVIDKRILMNTAEIKLELFRRIDSLKAEQLEEVYRFFLSYVNNSDESLELKSGIERALKDVDEGRVSAHEDVMKRMRQKYPTLID